MVSRIRWMFTPILFEDEERQRSASVLNTILVLGLSSVVATWAISMVVVRTSPDQLARSMAATSAGLIFLLGLWLLRRRCLPASALVTSVGIWLFTVFFTAVSGGVQGTGPYLYVIAILIAGLVSGRRAGIFMAVVSAVSGLVTLRAEALGMLPPVIIIGGKSAWFLQAITFLWVALSIHIYSQRIRAALGSAKRSNRALQDIRATLEERVAERTADLEAASKQLRYLSRAIEQTSSPIVITDKAGAIEYANLGFTQSTGYTLDEVVGKNPRLLKSGHTSPEEYQQLWDTITAGGEWQGQFRNRTKSGKTYWEYASIVPIRNGEGEITHFLKVGQDITERREAEKLQSATYRIGALAHSQESLDQLYRSIHQIIGELMDTDNFYIALYDEEEDWMEFPYWVDEKDPKPVSHRSSLGTTNYVLQKGETVLIAGEGFEELARQGAIKAYGTHSAVWLGAPLKWKGKTSGVIALQSYDNPNAYTERDKEVITFVAEQVAVAIQRRRAEEALQRSNERLETMHQIDQAILAARSPTEIAQAIADRIRELLACERVSVTLFDLAANTYSILAVATVGETTVPVGGPYPLETFGDVEERRQGQVNIIEDTAALSPNPEKVLNQLAQEGIRSYISVPLIAGGNLIGALNLGADRPKAFSQEHIEIAREVADQLAIAIQQAQLQESLEDTNAELEEAIQVKDEMIANVSHELRTPLTQIIGYSELVMDGMLGGDLNPDQQHAVDVILGRAQTLNSLVNMLLNFQMLSPEGFDWDEVSLNNLIDMTQVGWQEEAQKRGVALETRIVPHLPPVRGDLPRLQQVLDQLLDNALKFMPEGGTVSIRADRRADEIWLCVSDTGIGIAADRLEQVFERFYQVDGTSTRQYGGTGIGLSLVQRIVELHGGRVWAESEGEGRGTTFWVALPVAATAADEED